MFKEIRRKVMQIANRLVKQGYIRSCAMLTAWKLVKLGKTSSRVAGTTFDGRQNIISLLAKCNPAHVSIKLMREQENPFDSNAVAVIAIVRGQIRAVIGYLPKAVASVVAALMDKGIKVISDNFRVVGGYGAFESYGVRISVTI